MTYAGVRQIKARLSHYLKRVQQGEPIIITSHGRQIAQLSSLSLNPEQKHLLKLAQEGVIRWSGKKFNPPLPRLKIRGKPLSQIIIEDREDRA